MTLTDISQKVASLAEAHRETMSLIARLRKLERTGPDTTGPEIVALIHQNLKESEQDLELLLTQIEDEPVGEQRNNLISKWNKLSEDTKIARVSYRKAQMEAKHKAEAIRRKERERLLGHGTDGKRKGRNDKLSQDELLVNASSDITSSLKRTHTLLESELSRSQFASETLNASTLALRDLSSRYSTLDDILLKSRRLITDLVRKNKSDSWYYEKAIYIMVTTIIWLIVRRFLYGPFYLLVWLPLKLCWWILSGVGVVIGAGSGQTSELLGEVTQGEENSRQPNMGMAQSGKIEIKGTPEDLPTISASIRPVESQVKNNSPVEASEENVVEPLPSISIENETGADTLLEQVGDMIDKQKEAEAFTEPDSINKVDEVYQNNEVKVAKESGEVIDVSEVKAVKEVNEVNKVNGLKNVGEVGEANEVNKVNEINKDGINMNDGGNKKDEVHENVVGKQLKHDEL